MQLTEKQEKFRQKANALYNKWYGRPYILRLRGYAGTGKTTCLKAVHEAVGSVVAIAPTGKASLRIQEATGIEASTIHRWLYSPREDDLTGEMKFSLKSIENMSVPDSHLVFLDEGSMVDEQLWDDIYEMCLTLRCNIVVIGDPFQLPPVNQDKESNFNLMGDGFKADDTIDLTEVMRQALDSPIIRASMMIRKGDVFEGLYEIPRVMEGQLPEKGAEVFKAGGMVMCHRNVTRQDINNRIRKLLGYEDSAIHPGEPLVVLRNNYKIDDGEVFLYNGEVVTFKGWERPPAKRYEVYDKWARTKAEVALGLGAIDRAKDPVVLGLEEVLGKAENVSSGALAETCKRQFNRKRPYLSANLGYCLTVHKSQGSEADKALVVVEGTIGVNDRNGQRWLYTGLTRAKKEAAVCFIKKIW